MPRWSAVGLGAVAGLAGLSALGLAAQHPVSPALALGGVLGMALLSAWRAPAWLFVLPALLPLLQWAPWTGWWLVDETDLLVLAVLASGYARWALALQRSQAPANWPGWSGQGLGAVCLALALVGLLGTLRGWLDAPAPLAWEGALYAGVDSAWNSLRVAKSLLWALLLLPLLRQARRQSRCERHFAAGMVTGLLGVGLLVLRERQLYAGVLDFSQPYRTSAWFWEMHLGGGAIDSYLALAVPFACWALWVARTRPGWWAALALLALGVYAVLTTYSRGVALAVLIALGGMLALALWLGLRPAAPGVGRGAAVAAVLLLLGAEAALVLGGGAVLQGRLAQASTDLGSRSEHWRSGLDLLRTPLDGLLGLGMGRLPAHYSRSVPGGEYPGQAVWHRDAHGRAELRLRSPERRPERAAAFGLTQRVRLQTEGRYSVRWQLGDAVAEASGESPLLLWRLCERHLLHDARCQQAVARAVAGAQTLRLQGPDFERTGGVLSVTALGAAQVVHLQRAELLDPQGRQVLRNTAFSQQLRHWWPSAQGHFEPWHIDNLYLELLIERGLLGLVVMGAWLLWAARQLLGRLRQREDLAWALSGALLGLLALGGVVSLLENPRLALLAMLCMWLAEPKESMKKPIPLAGKT